jgi:hypothetical protein
MMRRNELQLAAGAIGVTAMFACNSLLGNTDVSLWDGGGRSDAGTGQDATPGVAKDASKIDDGPQEKDGGPRADGGLEDGNTDSGPQGGAVVVAGIGSTDGGYEYVLSVLDPATGMERMRESMAVVGVAYDGVRDAWYVLEDLSVTGTVLIVSQPFPQQGDNVVLHTRQLDTNTGTWTTLATVSAPTIATPYGDMVALNDGVSYVAYTSPDAGGDAGSLELAFIDTTNLKAPAVDTTPGAAIPTLPKGLIGTPASGESGGYVAMVLPCQNSGDAGTCQFMIQAAHVATGGGITFGSTQAVGPTYEQSAVPSIAWTSLGEQTEVVAFPSNSDGGVSSIEQFAGISQQELSNTITFTAASTQLDAIAISQCLQTAFLGERTGFDLIAVPLSDAAAPSPLDIEHSANGVRFEPYTNTVIDSFNGPANAYLSAISVSDDLSLSVKSAWSPPTDLRPNYVVTKQPVQFTCPP